MKFDSEVDRLARIRQELMEAAALMPKEEEVTQIIREILATGTYTTPQPLEQVSLNTDEQKF